MNAKNTDRVGVLITNLGTPDSYQRADVKRYLREFLSDTRVVETPEWWRRALWWLVLRAVILPTRPRKSAVAYQKVWRDDGSPLLAISRQQKIKLQAMLGDDISVELGMRYGNPSIHAALNNLRDDGVRRVLVLPLYPQYCAATTASAFDAVAEALRRQRWIPALRTVTSYCDHSDYIAALADSVRDYRHANGMSEKLLMSFHGIPQATCDAGDPYADDCRRTAMALAAALNLADDAWQLSFQSRVGPAQWLQPYTDETLTALARGGTRSVQVICPGFSADCLETLEEIDMENRMRFLSAGGERFGFIPCLNDSLAHIKLLSDIVTANLSGWIKE